jgi:hypothetical protein
MRVSASLVCVLVLSMAGLVRAEPLNPKHVSADAKWLAHLDADAMRVSVVMDEGYKEQGENAKAVLGKVPELRTLIEVLDPVTNVKGVTVYGTQFKPAAVAILYANLNESMLGTLNEEAQKLPDVVSGTHDSHPLFTWTHGKGTPHQRTLTAAYAEPNMLVFGTSQDEVKNALDVLGGAKPNMAGKSPLVAAPSAGALVVARVAGLDGLKLPIELPIIKQVTMIGLTMGEDNNEAYLTGQVIAKDAKAAGQVKEAVDNALTAALQAIEDSDLGELLNAIQVSDNDKTVTIDVRGPADAGWKYLEKLVVRVAQEVKKRVGARQEQEKK